MNFLISINRASVKQLCFIVKHCVVSSKLHVSAQKGLYRALYMKIKVGKLRVYYIFIFSAYVVDSCSLY